MPVSRALPPLTPAVTLQPVSGVKMTLVSSVTESTSDMTLPHPIVAPVSIASGDAPSEIIVPRNVVVVPRVAAEPTAQVMPPVNAPRAPASITSTLEALAVVRVDPI